jgi:hypothetical protein
MRRGPRARYGSPRRDPGEDRRPHGNGACPGRCRAALRCRRSARVSGARRPGGGVRPRAAPDQRACLPTVQPRAARKRWPAAIGDDSSSVAIVSLKRLRKPNNARPAGRADPPGTTKDRRFSGLADARALAHTPRDFIVRSLPGVGPFAYVDTHGLPRSDRHRP